MIIENVILIFFVFILTALAFRFSNRFALRMAKRVAKKEQLGKINFIVELVGCGSLCSIFYSITYFVLIFGLANAHQNAYPETKELITNFLKSDVNRIVFSAATFTSFYMLIFNRK